MKNRTQKTAVGWAFIRICWKQETTCKKTCTILYKSWISLIKNRFEFSGDDCTFRLWFWNCKFSLCVKWPKAHMKVFLFFCQQVTERISWRNQDPHFSSRRRTSLQAICSWAFLCLVTHVQESAQKRFVFLRMSKNKTIHSWIHTNCCEQSFVWTNVFPQKNHQNVMNWKCEKVGDTENLRKKNWLQIIMEFEFSDFELSRTVCIYTDRNILGSQWQKRRMLIKILAPWGHFCRSFFGIPPTDWWKSILKNCQQDFYGCGQCQQKCAQQTNVAKFFSFFFFCGSQKASRLLCLHFCWRPLVFLTFAWVKT